MLAVKPLTPLPPHLFQLTSKPQILYVVTLGLIKISILVFYLQIATASLFRHLTIFSLLIVIVFTIVAGFMNGYECPGDPSITLTHKIFDADYAYKCIERPPLYYAQAAFNISSDFAILVLPMPWLLKIKMLPLKRWSMIALFSAGLIVPIASGLRIWGLKLWEHSGRMGGYTGGYLLFWSQVEVNTAIICASAPSLTPLLKSIFARLPGFRTNEYYYYYADESGDRTASGHWGSARHRGAVERPAETYQPTRRNTGETEESELAAMERVDSGETLGRPKGHYASVSTVSDWQVPRSPRDLTAFR